MPLAAPLLESRLNGLTPDRQGKVRDIYDAGDALLMIATDRISAFDYVLGSGIPDKGKVLNQLSTFWFDHTRGIVTNHVGTDVMLTSPKDIAAPNWKPATGSPVLTGCGTPPAGFDQSATFCGAVGNSDWTTGWTRFGG